MCRIDKCARWSFPTYVVCLQLIRVPSLTLFLPFCLSLPPSIWPLFRIWSFVFANKKRRTPTHCQPENEDSFLRSSSLRGHGMMWIEWLIRTYIKFFVYSHSQYFTASFCANKAQTKFSIRSFISLYLVDDGSICMTLLSYICRTQNGGLGNVATLLNCSRFPLLANCPQLQPKNVF